MRNIKIVILAILNILFAMHIVSCNNYKYETYVVDAASDEISFNIDLSGSPWIKGYFERNANEVFILRFEENDYVGKYENSIISKYNSFTTDVYMTNDGIEFGVKDKDGSLVYINFMNKYFFDTEPYLPEISNAKENSFSIAECVASKYIDISEYEMIEGEPTTSYKEKNGEVYEITYYDVMFSRKIKGLNSSDYISIKITSKGNVASIMMGDIGVFEDIDVNYDVTEVNEVIADTVASIYSKIDYRLDKHTIDTQVLSITPKGEVVLYSYLDLQVSDDSNKNYHTGIVLATNIS